MELARVNLILDNWTKWSAVWSKVLRGMREFDLISDQNCATPSSTTTFLQPFWNRRIQSVPNHYLLDLAAGLLKSGNKRAFYLILYLKQIMQYRAKMVLLKTDLAAGLMKSGNKRAFYLILYLKQMMQYRAKMVRLKTEMMQFRIWLTRFGTDVI